MMFRVWLSGNIRPEKDVMQFLQHMSLVMNTSVKQLKSTYISIDKEDYENTVRGMVTAFTAMVRNGEEADREGNVEEKVNLDSPYVIMSQSERELDDSFTSLCKQKLEYGRRRVSQNRNTDHVLTFQPTIEEGAQKSKYAFTSDKKYNNSFFS